MSALDGLRVFRLGHADLESISLLGLWLRQSTGSFEEGGSVMPGLNSHPGL